MKLLGLHLLAYGPFTNVELDLQPAGVHVVYGKNEAGKSTALRAITGLLYGIARNTPDAHVHKMPDLRVGGRFRIPEGSLYLVRRKGKDNTLLDREGRPVDEAVLARLLGGVSEEQFLSMFGLDHETLRRGGEALLLGEGNVGESLFGAAVAGGELHQVLRALKTEAETLFTPKAHTRSLNEALKSYADAHRRTRDESMSPESMFEQEKNLADLKRERAACDEERQRLQLERTKLQRACQALPVVGRRRLAAERLAAMGDVVRLGSDAPRERAEAQRICVETNAEIARLDALANEQRARRAELVVPESLVLHDEVPRDLANRLGGHLKANQDLPRIEDETRELEAEARERLRRAGRNADLGEVERWRIDAVKQAAIHKLAREKAATVEARQQTERLLEERRARRSALVERQHAAKPAPDVGALKKAVSRAERAGPLEDRLATALAQAARIEQKARAQLSSLGLGALSLSAASGLAIVSDETVERFARELAAIERAEENLAKQSTELEERTAELAREIQGLELEGKVPTERDLLEARDRRETSWQALRKSLERAAAKASRADLVSAYEKEVRAADDVADRLRREAERVGKLAALLVERDACGDRSSSLGDKKRELARRREAHREAWRAQWRPLGIDPGPPVEMKAWLFAHAALGRTLEDLASTDADVAGLRASIENHAEPLRILLAPHGSPAPNALLGQLLDRAADVVEAAELAAAERREIERTLEEIDAEIAAKLAEQREQERTHARIEKAWREAVAALGMQGDPSPDDVTMTLDLLAEMFHKLDQAAATRRRAAGILRDAEAFAADVAALAREHAPDLVAGTPEAIAAALLDRYKRGREALAERRALDRQIADTAELALRHRERMKAAEARIAELMAAARVDSLAALEVAERRSAEAADLERQLAALDAELLGMGLVAEALPDELRDLDLDTATVRLEEVEADLEELRQRTSVIDQRIGGNEEGRRKLEDPQANAATAALEAEAALASVREIAERYARIKVASVVLAREIERYRDENQGPILSRASALFGRLTLGSFSGLKTDFDEKDQPILLGVRGSGGDVRIGQMSDGTRDQLYLALYLATLERFARGGDPMPLIVDDVLIHFDDDRARAALEVLGELSEHTQVLFFTHHARLVELAREAIPGEKLFVRELDTGSQGPAVIGTST